MNGPLLGGPGAWARLGLVALLVVVPGSINLSITVLPLLLALGWFRPRRGPGRRPPPPAPSDREAP